MAPTETDNFFVNDYETLELTTVDGTDDTVAGIRGVTIEAEYQTLEHLYTADSTKRPTSKQAQFNAPINIEFAFFDGTFAEEWLGGTSVEDTTDPTMFELTGDFRNDDGTKQIEITVTDITFENIPLFDGSMDEFVVWGIDGEGADITNFEVTEVV